MKGKTNMTVANSLEKAESDLQWLLQTTENAVATLVTAFQALTGHTETILTLASAVVDRVEDESISSVLPNVRAIGSAANHYVSERLQATTGILDSISKETVLLRQLATATDGQAGIGLSIYVLNMHTKIEMARLGVLGDGFEYLARELAEFSRSLATGTQELSRHTNERKAVIDATKLTLSTELPHLNSELARTERNSTAALQVLDSGLTMLSSTPTKFRTSTEDIARQIASVVVAVQGHDITRQQIEHVQGAIAIISAKLQTENKPKEISSAELARAHAGLAIQISQLRAIKTTIVEWATQIRKCMDGILRMSGSELVAIGPLVQEQERSMSSQISHIELLERECGAYGNKIQGTLAGVSDLSQLVSEHLQKSESARSRLRLLTFNSIIEASRLGARADAICVIANGISKVSDDWNEITEQSGNALRQILGLSTQVNDVLATLTQSGNETLSNAQAQMRTDLESLRTTAAFAVRQGQKIGEVAELMSAKGEEIEVTSDLLDSCFTRIDSVSAAMEDIKLGLETNDPAVKDRCDQAEVERLFSESYTTEAERNVLRAALYGTVYSVEEQCSAGNDVELF